MKYKQNIAAVALLLVAPFVTPGCSMYQNENPLDKEVARLSNNIADFVQENPPRDSRTTNIDYSAFVGVIDGSCVTIGGEEHGQGNYIAPRGATIRVLDIYNSNTIFESYSATHIHASAANSNCPNEGPLSGMVYMTDAGADGFNGATNENEYGITDLEYIYAQDPDTGYLTGAGGRTVTEAQQANDLALPHLKVIWDELQK